MPTDTTTPTTYSILATPTTITGLPRSRRWLVLRDVPSYDEALAVYGALDRELRDDRFPDVAELSVRSGADPATRGLTLADDALRRAASLARAAYREAELRATVRYVLRRRRAGTFEATARRVGDSLAARSIPCPVRGDLERALKGASTIGRCHSCGRAWFWPRSEGTLATVRCSCGDRLAQTTLAYHRPFYRLNAETEEV